MLEGGCRCGRVRYQVALDRLPVSYACHCLDCQTWTGSAFSQQVVVAEGAFAITGAVGTYELAGNSGRISLQRACPICFTRLFNTNSARPGMIIIRAGSLDASADLRCGAHIWIRRKQSWLHIPDDVPTWSESVDPVTLASILDECA